MDRGKNWTRHDEGLALPEGETPITGVWSQACCGMRLCAGTKPAALFFSEDDGLSWEAVEGLNAHPTRPDWDPGEAGLTLHHIVTHP